MAIIRAGADGKAPAGAKVGDVVQTNGGDYLITGVNPDGTWQSEKQTAGYSALAAEKSGGSQRAKGQEGYNTYAPNVEITGATGQTYNTSASGMTQKWGSDVYVTGEGKAYTMGSQGWEEYKTPPLSTLQEQNKALLDAAEAWGGKSDPYAYDGKYDVNDYDAAYAQIAADRKAAQSFLEQASRNNFVTADYLTGALNGDYGQSTQSAAEAYARQLLEEEAYRKAYYANRARTFNEREYSGLYNTDEDYQEKINRAASSGNLADAAIWETLRNQKIREMGLDVPETHNYSDWLSTGVTGNSNILVDSHGKALGTLNYGGTTGTEGSPILDVPIIYSEIYGNNRTYGYTPAEILANLEANGQPEAAQYMRNVMAEGNAAKLQAILDNIAAYNSVGGMDRAYADYLETGRYPTMTEGSWYSNFGPSTVAVDTAAANSDAVLTGLAKQGIRQNDALYTTLVQAMAAERQASAAGKGNRTGRNAGGTTTSADDQFWQDLISGTDSRYQGIADTLREGIDAQTQQALAQYEAQKAELGQSYDDLYRQLYINRRKDEQRLPQVLAAQGQSGGMSESAALQLANAYNTNLTQSEKARLQQEASINSAMTNAELQGRIAASQSDAEVAQAALGAYQSLMQSMRSEQISQAQIAQELELRRQEMAESQRRWEAEFALTQQQYRDSVAAQAQADLNEKAQNLAAFGDFSGYAALGYSAEQIEQMRRYYAAMLMDNKDYSQAALLGASVPTAGAGGSNGSNGYADLVQETPTVSYAQMDAIRATLGQRGLNERQVVQYLQGSGIPSWQISDWAESRGLQLNNSAFMNSRAANQPV